MLNIASKVQLACEMMNKSFATTEKYATESGNYDQMLKDEKKIEIENIACKMKLSSPVQ